MKALEINTEHREDFAAGRSRWKCTLTRQLKSREETLISEAVEKRIRKKERCGSNSTETIHNCDLCDRGCHSFIGLFSHRGCCSSKAGKIKSSLPFGADQRSH